MFRVPGENLGKSYCILVELLSFVFERVIALCKFNFVIKISKNVLHLGAQPY